MTTASPASIDHARNQPTIIFVHGTNSSSLLGASLITELTLRGNRAVAIDLPGHGAEGFVPDGYFAQDLDVLAVTPSPLAVIGVDDYVERVIEVVRRAKRFGPVILAGASQGGVVLSRVGNAVPELVDRIVYMAAYCCVDLPTLTSYLETPENERSLLANIMAAAAGDPRELGVARINWRTTDPALAAGIVDCLAGGFDEQEARRLLTLLEPDEPAGIPLADARGRADAWGLIPRTYVRFSADRLIPLELQDRFIREADALTPDNLTDVRTIDLPHVGPFDHPEIVEILAGLAADL